MDNWIHRFKAAERIDTNTEVLIPGELEHRAHLQRAADGIELNPQVQLDLEALAAQLQLVL
jgi:LDH2 family malate/lactate/ureidoglycolate dehydrogenase